MNVTHIMGRFSLILLGDCMLGRLVDESLSITKGKVWGDTLRILHGNHRTWPCIVAGNLETAVTYHDKPTPKTFNFKMKPSNIYILNDATFRYVSLANNHILDYGDKGLLDTVSTLEEANIAYSGAGKRAKAETPAFLEVDGTRLAFLSYSDHYDFWKATDETYGINFVDPNNFDEQKIRSQVSEAKKSADMVIVFIHWGPNWSWKPSSSIQRLGKVFVDAGAGLVFGHSSHHIQGIEFYKGCPIIYGAGGFIDDYALDEDFRNDLGFIYEVVIDKASTEGTEDCRVTYETSEIEVFPIKIEHSWRTHKEMKEQSGPPYLSSVNLAKDLDALWLQSTIRSLCREFNTQVLHGSTTSQSLKIVSKDQNQ